VADAEDSFFPPELNDSSFFFPFARRQTTSTMRRSGPSLNRRWSVFPLTHPASSVPLPPLVQTDLVRIRRTELPLRCRLPFFLPQRSNLFPSFLFAPSLNSETAHGLKPPPLAVGEAARTASLLGEVVVDLLSFLAECGRECFTLVGGTDDAFYQCDDSSPVSWLHVMYKNWCLFLPSPRLTGLSRGFSSSVLFFACRLV